jgi:hypothetical protein
MKSTSNRSNVEGWNQNLKKFMRTIYNLIEKKNIA